MVLATSQTTTTRVLSVLLRVSHQVPCRMSQKHLPCQHDRYRPRRGHGCIKITSAVILEVYNVPSTAESDANRPVELIETAASSRGVEGY